MAKATLKFKDGSTVVFTQDDALDFFVNYDDSTHGEQLARSSNTGRYNKYAARVRNALAATTGEDGSLIEPVLEGYTDNGEHVFVAPSEVASVSLSD